MRLEDVDFVDELHQSVFIAAQKLYSGHQRMNSVSLKPFVIHPETGRRRKDRATACILLALGCKPVQHHEIDI